MKSLIIILVVLLIAGGAFFVLGQRGQQDSIENTDNNSGNGEMMGGAENVVPAPEDSAMTGDGATNSSTSTEGEASGVSVTAEESGVAFDVTGMNFEFSVKEIKVKEGDTVTINFASTGGVHDWVVDEFNANTEQVNTGKSSSVTFVADKAGEYEFYCSVGTHRQMGMVGKLIVE
jgi:plastocyanin